MVSCRKRKIFLGEKITIKLYLYFELDPFKISCMRNTFFRQVIRLDTKINNFIEASSFTCVCKRSVQYARIKPFCSMVHLKEKCFAKGMHQVIFKHQIDRGKRSKLVQQLAIQMKNLIQRPCRSAIRRIDVSIYARMEALVE